MKKVLVLEGSPKTQCLLEAIFASMDIRTTVYVTDSVEEAYVRAMSDFIDLFVIDIVLDSKKAAGTPGITFVEKIRQIRGYMLTPVVFISRLEDPKFYAYSQLHCYSYLEKPFDFKETARQFTDILTFAKNRPQMNKHFYFRKDGILYSVETRKIVTIEIQHKKIVIQCVDERVELPYMPLNELQETLGSPYFLKCNRSAIVNRSFIRAVDTVNNYVLLADGFGHVDIGRVVKSEFLYRFRNGF